MFSAIDPQCFLECFVQWVRGICPALGTDVVAIDGKALRCAFAAGASLPYVVSAWASDNGLVLGQVKVDDKSNEITAIPQLLHVLEINHCIVTIDAMGCQKEIAAQIVDRQADYVLALKGNHATVHEEVQAFFADVVPPCARHAALTVAPGTIETFETVEKGHGRIETRRYWQSTDIDWFEDRKLWKHLHSFGMVESIRCVKGTNTIERRYFLSSLPLDVHLMIVEPERYLEAFAEAGADVITVHAEATPHLQRAVARIRELGKKAGVALNPSTSLSAVEWVLTDVDMVLLMTVNPGFGGQAFLPSMAGKIELLRTQLSRSGLPVDIEVDGGIKADNIAGVVRAGANVIVSGSGIFGTKDYGKTIAQMKENIRKAVAGGGR